MIRAVIDTNVLASVFRSNQGASFGLLAALADGRFQSALSVPLLFEYEDVLRRDEMLSGETDVDDVLDSFCHVSHLQQVHFLWRPWLKDPKDDMVLELAVASGSQYIVTFNVRDFATSDKFGVSIVRPHELLNLIDRGRT